MRKATETARFFLITCIVLGLSSCARKETADTPYARLIGKWKKINYATDDNGNGSIDPFEIRAVEGGVNNVIVFNKDSTGYETNDYTATLNFNWKVRGDSIYRTGSGHLSVTYHMDAVNSYNLTLTTNTTLGLAWYMYKKQ